MDIGYRLQQLRAGRGRSLRECAAFLGVSPSYICLVEAGKRTPNAFLLGKWMAYLEADQSLRGEAVAMLARKKLPEQATVTIADAARVLRSLLQSPAERTGVSEQTAGVDQDSQRVIKLMSEDLAFRAHVLHLARLPTNRRALVLNAWSALGRVFPSHSDAAGKR